MISFVTNLVPEGIDIVALNPSDGFMVLFWSSISIGLLIFCLFGGIVIWFITNDILYDFERKIVLKNILPSVLLFLFGFLFGLYMYLGLIIPYFVGINASLRLENIWSLNVVLTSALMIGASIGLSFQLPLVIRNVIRFGLVKKEVFIKNRLIVFLVILVLSAFITPPDMVSQLLVGSPLYLLFELSLIGVKNKYE